MEDQNPLLIANVRDKIAAVRTSSMIVLDGIRFNVPAAPARDIAVDNIAVMRGKPGLSSREGQARLLHDLASIELQAMELAFRSLADFQGQGCEEFHAGLAELAVSEAYHLEMCLDGLDYLGVLWGTWPVHLALWEATAPSDDILDRLVVVHRYLEGGGLDAGVAILRKLSGVAEKKVTSIVKTIVDEEIGHVSFGSHWYRRFCDEMKIDSREDFPKRLSGLMHRIPRRLEKIEKPIRTQAGFTEYELEFLEALRENRPWSPASCV